MKYWAAFKLADCVVIPVNNRGVMGAGLAKALKPHIPTTDWEYYLKLCRDGAKGGDAYYSWSECWIYAFTKENWKDSSKLIWIEQILQNLILLASPERSILIPHMGCGLGGLNWDKAVKPLYDHYLPLMSWKEIYLA